MPGSAGEYKLFQNLYLATTMITVVFTLFVLGSFASNLHHEHLERVGLAMTGNADVLFSHCLCPDCTAKAMKDLDELKGEYAK